MAAERDFALQHQEALLHLSNDLNSNEVWGIDGASWKLYDDWNYDHAFSPLFPLMFTDGTDSFESLLTKRRERGRRNNVLELFGGGFFVDNLSLVDNMVAVRFKDDDKAILDRLNTMKEERLPQAIDLHNRVMSWDRRASIEENLYFPQAWRKITEKMQERGIPDIDVIMCLPRGAFYKVNDFRNQRPYQDMKAYSYIYLKMLEGAVQLLSENQGVLFTELPAIDYPDELFGAFLNDLNRVDGLTAEVGPLKFPRVLGMVKDKAISKGAILSIETCRELAELAENAGLAA